MRKGKLACRTNAKTHFGVPARGRECAYGGAGDATTHGLRWVARGQHRPALRCEMRVRTLRRRAVMAALTRTWKGKEARKQ